MGELKWFYGRASRCINRKNAWLWKAHAFLISKGKFFLANHVVYKESIFNNIFCSFSRPKKNQKGRREKNAVLLAEPVREVRGVVP
jgi:hypothetical protein